MFKRVQKSNPFDSFVSPGVANVYVTRGKRSQTTDAIEGGTSLPGEPHLSGSAPPRLCQYDPDGNLVSDGVFAYCYDSASRLTTVTSNGVTVAAYAYDAFGNTIAATGPLATTFPHRFSTKYFDPETGLCYYGYRYYSPSLMRWINRDPIEEEGGVNLYAFCKNGPSFTFDKDGRAYFAYRPLAIASFVGVLGQETFNLENMVIAHENLFFEDGKKPSNLGFFPEGVHMDYDISGYRPSHTEHFNDCVMRKAVKLVHPKEYSLLGDDAHKKYNCQDWAEDVRRMYNEIAKKEYGWH